MPGFFMERVRRQLEVPDDTIDGNGVTIAVLDSGISRHPDLQGKILCFQDFVGKRNLMYDDNGHGTHVCGILCGSGELSNRRYQGMAPASMLVVGKILDAKGDGRLEHLLEALEWIEKNRERYHIRIINISVGIGNSLSQDRECLLQKKLEELWDCGVLVVCAAGNKGPANNSISSVGGCGKILTVGCHDGSYCRDNPNRCETYSGRGDAGAYLRKPDLVAPGTDIISCNAEYANAQSVLKKKRPYIAKSGTSMATPIVAGAAALALQKYPDMTNEELKQKITITAMDLNEPWNKQGWGMVNVRRLLS